MGKQVSFFMHDVSIYVAYTNPKIHIFIYEHCTASPVLIFINVSMFTISVNGSFSIKSLKYGLNLLNLTLKYPL